MRKTQPPAMDSIPFHTRPCAAAGTSSCRNVRPGGQPATLQAWNPALSFYNSLKALPQPLRDACKGAGWAPGPAVRQLEGAAGAPGLAWNGRVSNGGGA